MSFFYRLYYQPGFKTEPYIIIITVNLALAVGIELLANPINTMKISDIYTVLLESLDEAVYGTLTSENKHMDFVSFILLQK